MTANQTPFVPESFADVDEWCRKLGQSLNLMLKGRLNVVKAVTLTANAATTTVTDNRIGPDTVLECHPVTANAAAALGGLWQIYPNTTDRQATLNHASNAQTDKSFAVILIG